MRRCGPLERAARIQPPREEELATHCVGAVVIFPDLRSFLDTLAAEGQLLTISDPVMPEPDLGAAVRALNNLGEGMPAIAFDHIVGYREARVVMNVHGSWANHAIMMGLSKSTPVKEQFFQFARRWKNFPVGVERAENAPFREVAITERINLFELLPLFRLNTFDGGPYIDKACVVTRDPNDENHFGKQNVGIYRLQVKGRDRLGVLPVPHHDMGLHLRAAEERGQNLPVSIAIGCDPIITLLAATPLGYDQSEYEMAGALQGAPYRIVKASLSDIDVPWSAEYLLEGEVLYGVREPEGPFGEFTGHYSGGRSLPVIRIDKVSHRRAPIFEQLYLGMPWTELDYLIGLSTCVPIYSQLKEAFPNEVVAVNAMYTHGLIAIIATRQRYGGFAKAVGMRAMTTPHGLGYCKFVILVDADVDPFNLPQVMWAISTKVQPRQDIVTIPGLSVIPLDPGSDPPGISDKVIIDATTPVAPDERGHYGQPLEAPTGTAAWEKRLAEMLKTLSVRRGGE
jgi:4-hydroxybenzoate decarboxylase